MELLNVETIKIKKYRYVKDVLSLVGSYMRGWNDAIDFIIEKTPRVSFDNIKKEDEKYEYRK